MKILFVILMLCMYGLLSQPVYAQYFNRLNDTDSTFDWGYNVFAEPDGTLKVFGIAHNQAINRWQLHYNAYDANGVVTSTTSYYKSGGMNYYMGNPGTVRKLPSGNFLHPFSQFYYGPGSAVHADAGWMKVSPTGTPLLVKTFTDTLLNIEEAITCCVLANGDYAFGGYTSCNTGNCNSFLYIQRTDSLGNVKWKRVLGKEAGKNGQMESIAQLANGNILIGGSSGGNATKTYNNQTRDYYKRKPWFLLMDTAGVVLWDTLLNTRFAGGGTIYPDPLGGYYHYGMLDSFIATSPLGYDNLPDYVAHLDENFQFDWIHHYAIPQTHRYVWNVKPLRDGNLLVMGFRSVSGKPPGWATKLDRNTGNTIWENGYSTILTTQYLVDAVERPDKSIMLVGSGIDTNLPEWRQYDVWLVGIDSNGCELPGCTPLGVPERPMAVQGFALYPNPSSGHIKVEFPAMGQLLLYNALGQVVEQVQLNDADMHQEIALPALPQGLYTWRYLGEGNHYATGKLLVMP